MNESIAQHLIDVVALFAEGTESLAYPHKMGLITRAKVAIDRAFPVHHPYAIQMTGVYEEAGEEMATNDPYPGIRRLTWQAKALVEAAHHDYHKGYLRSVTRAVELNTVDDILLQAKTLLEEGYLAASAILAGGALETHLKVLAAEAGISLTGSGGIAAYNNAIRAQERAGGAARYDKEAAKEVLALGGLRNKATHAPAHFDQEQSAQDVRLMIERVHHFVHKHD